MSHNACHVGVGCCPYGANYQPHAESGLVTGDPRDEEGGPGQGSGGLLFEELQAMAGLWISFGLRP